MKNKRQHSRYSIKCDGKMSEDSDENYKFIMNDISAGGMNISTDKEIEAESTLTIQIDLGQVVLPGAKQLQGVVVRKKEDQDVFNYGIRFSGLTDSEVEEIDAYLKVSHFSSLVHMV